MLRKVICPYEYMNDWKTFYERSLPEKENFLNKQDIAGVDYAHAERACKDFEIKSLGEYFQGDTSLLADVFENFRNICLKIYELDPSKFDSALVLTWEAALKKTKIKLIFLTNIDMLLMTEKGIRGEIFHSIYRYAKS